MYEYVLLAKGLSLLLQIKKVKKLQAEWKSKLTFGSHTTDHQMFQLI